MNTKKILGMDKKTLHTFAKLIDTILAMPTVTKLILIDYFIKYAKTSKTIDKAVSREDIAQQIQQFVVYVRDMSTEEINFGDLVKETEINNGRELSKEELDHLLDVAKKWTAERDIKLTMPDE